MAYRFRGTVMMIGVSATILAASMTGGEGGAYLRYPSGAAALGTAGANAASPSYLLSWWNPSLLCLLEKRSVAFGGGIRAFGQSDGFGALEFKVPPRVGMGLFLLYRGDPFLNNLYDENENSYPSAAYTTFTGKIALSYYINRRLTAGGSIAIRYVSMPSGFSDGKIASTSTTGIGSFDFALTWQQSKKLMLTAQIRDLGATMDWNFSSYYYSDFNVPSQDVIPLSLLLGSSYTATLLERSLIWNTDLRCYFPDNSSKPARRPQASLSSGCEWQYRDNLSFRLGLGDILFNGDITADSHTYWNTFSFRLAGGVSYELSKVRKGMRLNYGCSTDKVWAGVDQQVDITWQF